MINNIDLQKSHIVACRYHNLLIITSSSIPVRGTLTPLWRMFSAGGVVLIYGCYSGNCAADEGYQVSRGNLQLQATDSGADVDAFKLHCG